MNRALTVVIALVASALAVVGHAAEPARRPAAVPLGIGEDLVLVVGEQAPSVEHARAVADRIGLSFGHVQGMYVDAAVNYAINGIYVQTSADRIEIACPRMGAVFQRRIDGVAESLECPGTRPSVRLFRPVELRYVGRSQVTDAVFPSRCGVLSAPPCQRERYREMLGDAVTFSPDTQLVASAFRTVAGAESFVELARTLGVGGLVTVNARKLGGTFVGLGQEEHPDGSGPLLRPLPDPVRYQR